jgi:hypothetical protein
VAFDKLAKPSDGIGFWVWRIYTHFNWAKTLTWCDQAPNDKERTTRLISIHIVEREFEDGERARALSLILGPIKLMFGFKT